MPNTIEEDEVMLCCRECGNDYTEDEGFDDEFCCTDCHDRYHGEGEYYEGDEEEEMPERKWGKGDFAQFQSKESGNIVKSQRAFSVEIETYFNSVCDVRIIHDNTPSQIGISPDGSLGDCGVEFQTPKLRGKSGENLITDLCTRLNNNDFRVNKSCGLHVHIDGKGLMPKTRTKHEPRAIKNLLNLYVTYEDVIQSILPRSRRDNNYARHVRHSFHRHEIDRCNSLEEVEKMWYRVAKRKELKYQKGSHYNQTRYNGLNLHSLFSDGHLEIRYHSGTINSEKILHWVQLHTAMVDYAKMAYMVNYQNDIVNLREKTTMLFNLLNLSDATREYYYARQNLFSGNQVTEQTEDTENRSY